METKNEMASEIIISKLDKLMQIVQAIEKSSHPLPHVSDSYAKMTTDI
jgi:hypothetical protein